jgi:hypothetical protein
MEVPYYLFTKCTNFNWVNCDHPYDSTSKFVTINISFSGDISTFENMSFINLYYPSLNIALSMYGTSLNKTTKTVTYRGYAPVGPNCKVVFTAPQNATLVYYSEVSAGSAISDGIQLSATPVILNENEYKAKLNAL